MPMLELDRVHIAVDGRPILRDIDLTIEAGTTHVMFGLNGSGKTSLLAAIMGLPSYRITSGRIRFQEVDVTALPVDERARLGIALAYQRPPTLRGLRLGELADLCAWGNPEAVVADRAEQLHLGHLLRRDVNEEFSGGELKKSELRQLMLRRPRLALIDEPDAGVDLDSLGLVGETIGRLLAQPSADHVAPATLIITHTGHVLQYLHPTASHVLYGGTLAAHAEGASLLAEIREHGHGKCPLCRSRLQ